MLTLALDTTTRAGSVAVLRGDVLLSLVHGDATRTHGERLPEEIDRALQNAGIGSHELELLAVARGPGAFTGLRIGLAAIQGLAMVRQIPTIGVSALDALADAARQLHGRASGPIAAWMDAQRGEVFAAHYLPSSDDDTRWDVVSEPVVARAAEVLHQMPPEMANNSLFIGDGAVRFRAEIDRLTNATAIVQEAPAALAPFIARVGLRGAARGEAGPPHALQPLYVRRPDAELSKASKEPKASNR